MNDNLMRVQPIRNGTVIDHIKAGRGRKVLDALELIDKGTTNGNGHRHRRHPGGDT